MTAKSERDAVVRWLRELSGDALLPDGCTTGEVWVLRRAADAIERGEHDQPVAARNFDDIAPLDRIGTQ